MHACSGGGGRRTDFREVVSIAIGVYMTLGVHHVLQIDSARKLRWFDQDNLSQLVEITTREKQALKDTIAALRQVSYFAFFIFPMKVLYEACTYQACIVQIKLAI